MKRFDARTLALPTLFAVALFACVHVVRAEKPLFPKITGDAWQIAGNPDLGGFTDAKQEVASFTLWPATNGAWQLWATVRKTRIGGQGNLLHRWEGATPTARDWKPLGMPLLAEPRFGELPGGLQSPFVVRDGARFTMFYGDGRHIASATGEDGKTFARRILPGPSTGLFDEGPKGNARDPMVLRIGGKWHCYYTAHPTRRGTVFCRTSENLITWSESRVVATGGQSGAGPQSAEHPFVVEPQPGHFYLFRTQRLGADAQTSVYHSRDPFDFGINDDTGHFLGTLPLAAPELILLNKQWFIASLLPTLKGIRVARLEWAAKE